jgi:alanine racemase
MHRLGFEENTMNELIAALQGNETVHVKVSYRISRPAMISNIWILQILRLHYSKNYPKLLLELQIKPLRHILNTSELAI